MKGRGRMEETGMERPGTKWPGMERPGMVRQEMERPGMEQPGMERQEMEKLLRDGLSGLTPEELTSLAPVLAGEPGAGTDTGTSTSTDTGSAARAGAGAGQAAGRRKTRFPRWAAAAAAAAILLLAWNREQVYAGLRRLFQKVPGVGVTDTGGAYRVEPVDGQWEWDGWNFRLEEGFLLAKDREEGSTVELRLRMSGEGEGEPPEGMTETLVQGELYQNGRQIYGNSGEKSTLTEEREDGDGGWQLESAWRIEGGFVDFSRELSFTVEILGEEAFTFTLERIKPQESLGNLGLSDEDGVGAVLIEKQLTEEGLEILYYPYIQEEGMGASIPGPWLELGSLDAEPVISAGGETFRPLRYERGDGVYSQAVRTVFPAEAAAEGAVLTVPYLYVLPDGLPEIAGAAGAEPGEDYVDTGIPLPGEEGTSREGRETKGEEAAVELVFPWGSLTVTGAERLTYAQASQLYEGDLDSGWEFYLLTVEAEAREGWIPANLSVGVGTAEAGYLYYQSLALPVFQDGKLSGVLCMYAQDEQDEQDEQDAQDEQDEQDAQDEQQDGESLAGEAGQDAASQGTFWVGRAGALYRADYKINLF